MRDLRNDLANRFAGVSRVARAIIRREAAEQRQPSSARSAQPVQLPALPPRRTAMASPAPAAVSAAPVRPTPTPAASERARVAAVFASEHANGRERYAAAMLETSATADEIIGCLAGTPRSDPAGATMLAALRATPNPDLGTGNGDAPGAEGAAQHTWRRLWGAAS